MRFRLPLIVLNLLCALFLAGCANATPNKEVSVPVEVPNVPQPPAGKAVVAGQVKKNTDQQPLTNTQVYLAQVYRNPEQTGAVYALDMARSPGTITDDQGFFVFNDIAPNEYVVVVGRSDADNDVVREQNGDAKVYKVEADKVLNVGSLTVKPIDPTLNTTAK